jgi:polyisoprenoid-binding protein YceI
MTHRLRAAVAVAVLATLAVSAGFAGATAAAAAPATYTVDPAHSEVSFQIRHLVTKVRGTFGQFEGTVVKEDADPAASSVEFTVQVASIDTGIDDRDNHLRSADFFDVAKYPTITFKSSKVERVSDTEYKVTGALAIHGVTKEVTLPVTFDGELKDPWGNTKGGFSTATRLNRKDFGINWNKALDTGGVLLGDEVDVQINLEVLKK